MYLSPVRLYHPAPWGWLYSYQALLITLRMMEHATIITKYFLVKAPLLLIWTRLPGTRHKRPPVWKDLAEVLAPIDTRPSLALGGGQLGTDLADAENAGEVSELVTGFMATVQSPPRVWSLVGSVLRGLFTEQGPAFIKFGQIMSMREELPATIKKELQLLQDKLPPMGPKEVKRRLERELGKPVEAVFEWVDYTPIAAGSLAQVHKAKLRKEQEEVALKIRRPYLEGIVTLDIIIICDIVIGLQNRLLPLFRKSTDTRLFTSSYRQSLEQEIDLVLEARYQESYRKYVMNHPIYRQSNYIARVYPEYTTTKLIVMELVKDYHRLDRLLDELTPEQLLEFATTKIDGYPPDLPLQLVFSQVALCMEGMCHWGLSHGDFHLGNLYALPPEEAGENWRIFICDFGMMMDYPGMEKLQTLQGILDLSYYFLGEILADNFIEDSDVPMSKKQKTIARQKMAMFMKKYVTEEKEGTEKTWNLTIQPNSSTNMVSAIVYTAATLGLKQETPYYWLLLKNFSYACNISLTMSTNLNGTAMVSGQPAKFVKDWTMAEVDELDVADLRGHLPEKLRFVRHDDRKQILKALATGQKIVPKERNWSAPRKDVRFVKQEKASVHLEGAQSAEGDDGHRSVEALKDTEATLRDPQDEVERQP
jgi:predicted unusual protein kinase regulating ubiquinone biosynthesis (AarF/ABC1/UbiB family)